jgi:hypothetical protein
MRRRKVIICNERRGCGIPHFREKPRKDGAPGTFAIVVFAFHIQEHKFGLKVSNYLYVVASLLAVVATIIIVNKTRSIDAEKDREVKIATDAANLKIAQAGSDAAKALSDAATANQKAQEAKLKAQETERSNTSLKVELNKHEEQEKENEIKLAAQNQQTAQFTQALQFQQQTMAQQIHVSPELNNAQIDAIAAELKPFAGQEVIIHRTDDTVVGRLASSIANAFLRAGIKFPQYSDDISQLYQGVTVVVHAPDQGHPPMADALVNALMRQGIPVNKGAIDSVPMGAVALYLGPQ